MKNVNKKLLVVTIVALILAVSCVVGTFAYLAMKTASIVNVFTAGNVQITLTEEHAGPYKLFPGQDITKDPVVTVIKGSEASWVFVKVEATADVATALTYSIDGAWTALTDDDTEDAVSVDGIYYKAVAAIAADGADVVLPVLTGNKVTVKNYDANTVASLDDVKLTFTAYAIQDEGFASAYAAWVEASQLG